MYRETKKYKAQCEKLARWRKAKDAKIKPRPDYPVDLPEVRKIITIESFEFGYEKQVMELRKSSRCDCYDVYIDGKLWKEKIGLSRILEFLRKANPRVLSNRRFE